MFTNHGYVPGGEAAPSPVRKQYQRMGFGARNGTIPGMGLTDPRPSGLTIKKQRA